jgi:hypothetical protein
VVGVRYDSVRGLVVAVRVRVCLTIIPVGICGQTRIWHRKVRCSVCIPLAEHVGHSLLWHPKSRSRALDGGSAVKVVHRLGRGVRH